MKRRKQAAQKSLIWGPKSDISGTKHHLVLRLLGTQGVTIERGAYR